jgi:hypothetical protein
MKKILSAIILAVAVFGNLSLLNKNNNISLNLSQLEANAMNSLEEGLLPPTDIDINMINEKIGKNNDNNSIQNPDPKVRFGEEPEDVIYHCEVEEYDYGNGEGHVDAGVSHSWGVGSVDVNAGASGNTGSSKKIKKSFTATGVNCIPRVEVVWRCIPHDPCI